MGAPFYFFTSGSVLIWLRHSSRHLAWVAYTSCMIPDVLAFIARSMLCMAFVIASTFSAFISFGFSSIAVVSITLHCAYVFYSIASFAAMTFILLVMGFMFPPPWGGGRGEGVLASQCIS